MKIEYSQSIKQLIDAQLYDAATQGKSITNIYLDKGEWDEFVKDASEYLILAGEVKAFTRSIDSEETRYFMYRGACIQQEPVE